MIFEREDWLRGLLRADIPPRDRVIVAACYVFMTDDGEITATDELIAKAALVSLTRFQEALQRATQHGFMTAGRAAMPAPQEP